LGVARRQKAPTDLPELLPGQGVSLRAEFDGVAATVLAVTKVAIDPVPVEGEALKPRSRQALTLAVPFTVLAVLMGAWLLRRARRSYLQHASERAGSNPAL
jgi:hypothetical protein